MKGNWITITNEEFLKLQEKAVESHTIGFCTPPVTFYWNADETKRKDKSFGQGAFLREIRESTGPEPYVWPNEYWKWVPETT